MSTTEDRPARYARHLARTSTPGDLSVWTTLANTAAREGWTEADKDAAREILSAYGFGL